MLDGGLPIPGCTGPDHQRCGPLRNDLPRLPGEEKAGKEGLKGDQAPLGEGSLQKGKDADRGCYREMRRKAFQE